MIVGKSGSGKSILLYIMVGFEILINGDVIIDNINILFFDEKKRFVLCKEKLGLIF